MSRLTFLGLGPDYGKGRVARFSTFDREVILNRDTLLVRIAHLSRQGIDTSVEEAALDAMDAAAGGHPMSHHVIEIEHKCHECKGTGLYVGMGERAGSAVVCRRCKGTGCYQFRYEYDDFEGRVHRDDVQHVVEANPGICIGAGKHGQYKRSDFGGMDYQSWWTGLPFPAGSEMRQFVCPRWWYQCIHNDRLPHWDECEFGTFPGCSHFPAKDKCWARWDAEFAVQPEATP